MRRSGPVQVQRGYPMGQTRARLPGTFRRALRSPRGGAPSSAPFDTSSVFGWNPPTQSDSLSGCPLVDIFLLKTAAARPSEPNLHTRRGYGIAIVGRSFCSSRLTSRRSNTARCGSGATLESAVGWSVACDGEICTWAGTQLMRSR